MSCFFLKMPGIIDRYPMVPIQSLGYRLLPKVFSLIRAGSKPQGMKSRGMPSTSASFLGFTLPFWWVKNGNFRSFLSLKKAIFLVFLILISRRNLGMWNLQLSVGWIHLIASDPSFSSAASGFSSLQKCHRNSIQIQCFSFQDFPNVYQGYIPCSMISATSR